MVSLYRHFDKDGCLLYVGVSLSAISRLAQHRDASHWFSEIVSVKIESFPDRKLALAAEQDAIRKENPRHNLRRPKAIEIAKIGADQSRAELVRRMVQFNPLYSRAEAGAILKLGPTAMTRLIESGQIGFLKTGTRGRVVITGWQLIEYLETAEASGQLIPG